MHRCVVQTEGLQIPCFYLRLLQATGRLVPASLEAALRRLTSVVRSPATATISAGTTARPTHAHVVSVEMTPAVWAHSSGKTDGSRLVTGPRAI